MIFENLRKLLALFGHIATPEQRAVFAAALVTTQWLGGTGQRPCIAFLGRGRAGAGKSCAIDLLGRLSGGGVAYMDHDVDRHQMVNLPESVRVVCFDNPRVLASETARLLENLVTCDQIQGRKLYKGEASRPNRFLYTFAAREGTPIASDLASRCYFVTFTAFAHPWSRGLQEVHDLMPRIKAECSEFLWNAPRAVTVPEHERFPSWFSEVLAPVVMCSDLGFGIRDPFDVAAANLRMQKAVTA